MPLARFRSTAYIKDRVETARVSLPAASPSNGRADMKKFLTFAGAAIALSCLAANAPAKAQAVFESIYTQPAQMVDGMNVGDRISATPRFAAATVTAAQKCGAGVVCKRRHGAH
jgi:hypothetical protein